MVQTDAGLLSFRIKQGTGLPVHVIQTCQIEKLVKSDSSFANFYKTYRLLASSPREVNIRDAIFGGRTEAGTLVAELTRSEIERGVQMHYLDYCRLVCIISCLVVLLPRH